MRNVEVRSHKIPVANQEHITESLARTPLYQLGVELKARFTSFGGWKMPVQFSGIIQEHHAVRNTAGMFDISHMGKFTLQGKNLISQLQPLVPSDLSRLQPGQAQYTVLLNPQAGIIDDIIIYYQGDRPHWHPKGSNNRQCCHHRLKTKHGCHHILMNKVQFQDISPAKALIAVQGPQATRYLQSVVASRLKPVKAFGHLETTVLGKPAFLARTGYTGEDGFEVMVDPEWE